MIEYEVKYFKDSSKTKKKYYLTNSKKNSYTATLTNLDSLNYRLILKDENGLTSNVTLLKSDFSKAEFINIECKDVLRYNNSFNYLTKNYDFFILSDTIIDNKSYSQYKFSSIKLRLRKRKKLGTLKYLIDKTTDFHLPIFIIPTVYSEWKTNLNLPNGIFYQKSMYDFYGRLEWQERLLNFQKIDRKIIIADECDYTKTKH